MKKLLLLLVLVLVKQVSFAQDGFRFLDKQYFNISTSIDPTSSIKEQGLDVVGELEFVGPIYAKIGVESFSKLTGGIKIFTMESVLISHQAILTLLDTMSDLDKLR